MSRSHVIGGVNSHRVRHKRRFEKAWNESHETALDHVRQSFVSARVLHFSEYDREFVVHVDASEHGVVLLLPNHLNLILKPLISSRIILIGSKIDNATTWSR